MKTSQKYRLGRNIFIIFLLISRLKSIFLSADTSSDVISSFVFPEASYITGSLDCFIITPAWGSNISVIHQISSFEINQALKT